MLLSRVFHAFGLLTWITINQASETDGQEECYSMTLSADNLEEKLNDLAAKIKPKIEDGALEITSSIDIISFHQTNSLTFTFPQIDTVTNRNSQSHINVQTTTASVTEDTTKANKMNTTPLSHKSPALTPNSNNPGELYTDTTTNRGNQSHSTMRTKTPAVTEDTTKASTLNTTPTSHKSPKSTPNSDNNGCCWVEMQTGTTFQKAEEICSAKNASVATIWNETMYQEFYDDVQYKMGNAKPKAIWTSMTYDIGTTTAHPSDAYYKWRSGAPQKKDGYTNIYMVVHKKGSSGKKGMWNNKPVHLGDGTVCWKSSCSISGS